MTIMIPQLWNEYRASFSVVIVGLRMLVRFVVDASDRDSANILKAHERCSARCQAASLMASHEATSGL